MILNKNDPNFPKKIFKTCKTFFGYLYIVTKNILLPISIVVVDGAVIVIKGVVDDSVD